MRGALMSRVEEPSFESEHDGDGLKRRARARAYRLLEARGGIPVDLDYGISTGDAHTTVHRRDN